MTKMIEKKEAWYKSRRMYGAILAAVCAALIQLGYTDIATAATLIASSFGVYSFTKPKIA